MKIGRIDPAVVPAGVGGGISENDADARYVRKDGGDLQLVTNSFEVNALISGERTNVNGDAANSENLYFLNDTITDGQAMRFAVNAGGNNTHLGRWMLFEESGGTDRLSILARADDSDRDGIKPGLDFDRGANALFVDDGTGRPLTVKGNFHIKGDLTVDGDTPDSGGGSPIEISAASTSTNAVTGLALTAGTWTTVSEFDDADIYINEGGWTRQMVDGRDYLRVPSGAAGVYEVSASLSVSSTLNDRLSVRMRLRHLRGTTVIATYSMSQNYWRSNSTIPAQLLGLTVAELIDLEAGDDIGLEIWGHRAATVTVAADGFISAVRQGGTQGVPGPAGGGLTQEQADNRYARQDSLGTASTRDDAYFLTSDGGILTGDLTIQADIEVNDNVTLGVAANDTIFLNGTPDILDTVADDWRSELQLGTAAVRNTGTGSGDVPTLGTGGVLATGRLASGGSADQVLTRTATGHGWAAVPGIMTTTTEHEMVTTTTLVCTNISVPSGISLLGIGMRTVFDSGWLSPQWFEPEAYSELSNTYAAGSSLGTVQDYFEFLQPNARRLRLAKCDTGTIGFIANSAEQLS